MLDDHAHRALCAAGRASVAGRRSSLLALCSACVVIGENESGLVIRRFGRPLPPGRLIALDGEAGYQARMLPPGWHFGLWRWQYKVVQRPARRGAARARSRSSSRRTARRSRPSACSRSEVDVRQLPGRRARSSTTAARRAASSRILTAGTYRINPALFDVVTARRAQRVRPRRRSSCTCSACPPDRVGIVTALDGRPIPARRPRRPVGRRPRQLPARAGVHRRRRLPRPAGGGAALGLVEPEPVVRRGRARSR